MKEETKNLETSVLSNICKYVWCKQKNAWKNGIPTIVNNDEILWLNEKHIEEGLDPKSLGEITVKYHSDHRRHRY